jgi:hypothetical protein
MMSNNFNSKWMDFSENMATPGTDKTDKSTSVSSVSSYPWHILQKNDEKELDEYLNNLREKNRYDPRSDLENDSKLWQMVLREAEKVDQQVYGNLHGFRCAGCRLKLQDNKLAMMPPNNANEGNYKRDRIEFLFPYKNEIISIFKEVEERLHQRKSEITG